MTRRGIVSAGNMLVDHVHQIAHWPQPGLNTANGPPAVPH